MKEFFRKKLVYLKRNTQTIPLLLLVIACCQATFNLPDLSSAVMGVASRNTDFPYHPISFYLPPFLFLITLFSILMIITFLSVYPKERSKKVNIPMYVIVMVMLVAVIVLECLIIFSINYEFSHTGLPHGTIDGSTGEVTDAYRDRALAQLTVNIVLYVISAVAIVTLPVYKRLLNKIDTSINDEYDTMLDVNADFVFDLEEDV